VRKAAALAPEPAPLLDVFDYEKADLNIIILAFANPG
jgi:hypothetical protein